MAYKYYELSLQKTEINIIFICYSSCSKYNISISHTYSHKRQLEKSRLNQINPKNRLLKGNNIWNVSVIDNIDFKEKSFTFGNIYDTTRATTHATIRIVFQFELLNSIESISDNEKEPQFNDDDDFVIVSRE